MDFITVDAADAKGRVSKDSISLATIPYAKSEVLESFSIPVRFRNCAAPKGAWVFAAQVTLSKAAACLSVWFPSENLPKGIALLKESKNKRDLQAWLQGLERYYADRIVPSDLETGRTCGELTAAAQRVGRIVPASDGLIAATARRHGLHVMTRNSEHFAPAGVLLLNPWTGQTQ